MEIWSWHSEEVQGKGHRLEGHKSGGEIQDLEVDRITEGENLE